MVSVEKHYEKLLRIVGRNVKRLRSEQGLTQEDMRDMGFDLRHIQRIEGGKRSINLYTLFRLSVALNTDIEELFRK